MANEALVLCLAALETSRAVFQTSAACTEQPCSPRRLFAEASVRLSFSFSLRRSRSFSPQSAFSGHTRHFDAFEFRRARFPYGTVFIQNPGGPFQTTTRDAIPFLRETTCTRQYVVERCEFSADVTCLTSVLRNSRTRV